MGPGLSILMCAPPSMETHTASMNLSPISLFNPLLLLPILPLNWQFFLLPINLLQWRIRYLRKGETKLKPTDRYTLHMNTDTHTYVTAWVR